MLTVAELTGLLRKYPGGYRVVVEGYENGYNDASIPRQIELDLDTNTDNKYYNGQHSEAAGGSPAVLIAHTKSTATDQDIFERLRMLVIQHGTSEDVVALHEMKDRFNELLPRKKT